VANPSASIAGMTTPEAHQAGFDGLPITLDRIEAGRPVKFGDTSTLKLRPQRTRRLLPDDA
jgi:hypothetical protein